MSEMYSNCNIQNLSFKLIYVNSKIIIRCQKSKENTEGLEICRGAGHFNIEIKNVTELDFSHCKLSTLPDCLESLPLKILNLSHNKLISIPNCITRGLFLIEELNLSNNKIEYFNEEPGCCCKLKILDISSNNFKYIPSWILDASTINLREFYYSKNIIGNTKDAQYKVMASYNFQKAVFSSTMLRTANVEFIKSIRTLKHLDLSNGDHLINVISPLEILFQNTSWYDTLEVLNLGNLNISFLPDNISNVVNLKELYINLNDLFYLPNEVCELKNLEVLDVSQNHLCYLPPSLENLTKLKVLRLQYNQLCKIDEIYKLEELVELDLYHNELDDFNNNFNIVFVDLEQNFFETKILVSYDEKKNLYRTRNGISDRLEGPSANNIYEPETCSSYGSTPRMEDSEDEYQEPFFESESWDNNKPKSNPDITSSDEEWDGCFEHHVPKEKSEVKFGPECYKIFEDPDEEK